MTSKNYNLAAVAALILFARKVLLIGSAYAANQRERERERERLTAREFMTLHLSTNPKRLEFCNDALMRY